MKNWILHTISSSKLEKGQFKISMTRRLKYVFFYFTGKLYAWPSDWSIDSDQFFPTWWSESCFFLLKTLFQAQFFSLNTDLSVTTHEIWFASWKRPLFSGSHKSMPHQWNLIIWNWLTSEPIQLSIRTRVGVMRFLRFVWGTDECTMLQANHFVRFKTHKTGVRIREVA